MIGYGLPAKAGCLLISTVNRKSELKTSLSHNSDAD